MENKVCVVIPVYKNLEDFTANELCSFERAYKILFKRAIVLTGPSTIEWSSFERFCESNQYSFYNKIFPASCFHSVQGYNDLLFSNAFYATFSEYSHMLIYQTDAYVFEDELDKWCAADFDYIGAPWFEGWSTNIGNENFIGAGNGGLSLRKITSFLKVTQKLQFVKKACRILSKFPVLRSIPLRWILSPGAFSGKNMTAGSCHELLNTVIHEDYFWAITVPEYFPWFKVATPQIAMYFSFENQPRRLFEMTRKLPFGCHAWEKYDPDFWAAYIKPR